jgi:hypothetical protein
MQRDTGLLHSALKPSRWGGWLVRRTLASAAGNAIGTWTAAVEGKEVDGDHGGNDDRNDGHKNDGDDGARTEGWPGGVLEHLAGGERPGSSVGESESWHGYRGHGAAFL